MGKTTLSIYYGTETGNSRSIAEAIAGMAAKKDVAVSVYDLVNVSAQQLARNTDPVVIVISTWNRGKPPFFARRFVTDLETGTVKMPKLTYTVVALGDEHYEHFCACGKNVDAILEKLDAKRFMPRTDLGSTFRTDILNWESIFWKHFEKLA